MTTNTGGATVYDVAATATILSGSHLGSVAVTVESGKTLTVDATVASQATINGVGALAFAPQASVDRDMGFVFSSEDPAGGTVNTGAKMTWSEAAAQFTFDPATGLYKVKLNGYPARAEEDNGGQNAATVVIQNVKQTPSKYFDKGGGNTPHAETIGAGTAVVLRDGMSYNVTWSRPSAEAGTTFTMADGSPMPFKPGQQWIVLLDRTHPATLTPKSSPAPSASSTKSSVVT